MCKANTTKQFVQNALAVHGDVYLYERTVYQKNCSKVTITCKIHGDFEQLPLNHIQGKGCKQCGQSRANKKNTGNKESFVLKAEKVHRNRFKYDLVVYVTSNTKVVIICSKHGNFEQTPDHHLAGVGCPRCNTSRGEKKIQEVLTTLGYQYIPQKRFLDCKNKLPLPFDVAVYNSDNQFVGLIEFQGDHHFEPVRIGKVTEDQAKLRLEYVQNNDVIKSEYCQKNNIPLLLISYREKEHLPRLVADFVKAHE